MEEFVIISTYRYTRLLSKKESGEITLPEKLELASLKNIMDGSISLEEDRLDYYNRGARDAHKPPIDEKPELYLKSMRLKKGLKTAKEVADLLNMDYGNYNRLESGKTAITKERAITLSRALNLSVAERRDFMLVLEHACIKKFRIKD